MTSFIPSSLSLLFAKSNLTLKQLGWDLHSPGNLDQWDGLIEWFMNDVEKYEGLLQIEYVKQWYSAAKKKVKMD
jgi:hypothetical protein